MANDVTAQMGMLSLQSCAADVVAREFLSCPDEEWAYRLGKSGDSELPVYFMRRGLLQPFSNTTVHVPRMLRAFLIGRFEGLQETQPDKAVELMTPAIEMLLDPRENFTDWNYRFIVELCRGLPHCLLPAVMRKLRDNPEGIVNVYQKLLDAATEESDAEQLRVLLTDQRFRSQSGSYRLLWITPEKKEAAIACVQLLLANTHVDTGYFLPRDQFYQAEHVDTCRQIRQLLLDDPRTTAQKITAAFLKQGEKCLQVLEEQMLTHPKANPKDLLETAANCWYTTKPFFPPIWKQLVEDPRLPDDAVHKALYEAARWGHHEAVHLLLEDRRITFGIVFNARLRVPESEDDFYRKTIVALDVDLIARAAKPVFLAIGVTALVMMQRR
ncbi:MAG: hypothetical protein JSS12_11555 [Verrucomicrobia bacterium]|nr:hypothetical protein [Verrucomicrobiota bacterium]